MIRNDQEDGIAHRATLQDVAREAGVSITTVNRVVGGAKGVREETARKVAEAAARVGYHGRNLLAQYIHASLPRITMGFVLHKGKQAFYRTFAEQIERAARDFGGARITAEIVFSHSQAPRDVARHLLAMKGRVDILAATAVNHHAVAEAVGELAEAGIPCYALLSDFAQGIRKSYFGLDNLKVGRGAAHMLSVASRGPGRIAIFVGGNRWHGHELRETGFRAHFREAGDGFQMLDTLVNLETRQLTYEATLDLLTRNRDLVGIYLAGGGMEGAIAAMREETAPRQIAMVLNESTAESRAALADGYVSMIIGTPLDQLCRRLVAAMAQCSLEPDAAAAGQEFFDPVLYLPEFS